jgi:TP901 family phage tail tape measure protein
MSITAASLLVKVGYDDSEADDGLKRTEGKVGAARIAIGSAIGNLGSDLAQQLPGAVFTAMTSMEDAMSPIGTLVGTQSQQFADLSAGIKDMVASSPDNPAELGGAAYTILSAGITDTNLALKALQDATDLAGAGLGSTEEATNLITSAMNSFKGEGLDSQKAAELFFGTIASGKTTTADLAQGFGGIAPLAAAAGVSFNDLMAATAAITATGAPASQAYSGLKGAITGIIKPSADAAEAAKELGINFSQEHLAAVGLPTFLEEIKTATGGNVETMARLFGSVEGLNTVLALTGPQADAFAGNLINVGAAGQNMQERAAETDQTVSARFATMKNKVMVSLSELGNKGFTKLFDLWAQYGPAITRIATDVVAGFRTFAEFITGTVLPAAQSLFGFLGDHEEILIGIGVAVGVVGLAIGVTMLPSLIAWAAAQWAVASAVIATYAPIAAIGIAIAALVAGVIWAYQNVGWFREAVQAVASFFTDTLWPILQEVGAWLGTAFVALWDAARVAIGWVVERGQELWDLISTYVLPIVTEIGEFIGNAFVLYFQGAKEVIGFVIDVFQELWDLVSTYVFPFLQTVGEWIGGAFVTSVNLGKDAVGFLIDKFQAVWDKVIAVKDGITTKFEEVVTFITDLPDRIANAASGMWDGIGEAFRGAINWMIDMWNGLEFTLPEVDTHIPGIGKVGGFGLSTPDIERLADGGILTSAGSVWVGERGPELLTLPKGASVTPLPAATGSVTQVNVNANIYLPVGANGDDVVRALKEYERLNGSVPITVGA